MQQPVTLSRPPRLPLAVRRFEAGLSQAELAKLAGGGLARETISRAETGRVIKPRARTQRALADALAVPIAVLFPNSDNGASEGAAVKAPAAGGRHGKAY